MCGSFFALAQKRIWDPIGSGALPSRESVTTSAQGKDGAGLGPTGTRRMHVEAARALIADHLAVGLQAVRDDAVFATDLGADSLDMIELAMRFEEAFDIHIPDDETASCETVRDALALLRSKVVVSKAA